MDEQIAIEAEDIAAALAASGPFGFGASSIGNLYKAISDNQANETVNACWNLGVRYFDTAPFYGMGLSEQRLGACLKLQRRSEYIVSTKVGRALDPVESAFDQSGFVSPLAFRPRFDYSYDGIMRSFEASLERLGIGHIDILYMHDIGRLTHGDEHQHHLNEAIRGGFKAMEKLKAEGTVRAIGLGVNESEICEESFRHVKLDVFMLAGRYSLLNHQPLEGFFDACQAYGTAIVGAGIFNSGILATGARPGAYYDYEPAPLHIVEKVTRIEKICEAHGVTLAAAALQFVQAHPAVATTVIGTAAPDRIRQTLMLAEEAIPLGFWSQLVDERLLPSNAPIPGKIN